MAEVIDEESNSDLHFHGSTTKIDTTIATICVLIEFLSLAVGECFHFVQDTFDAIAKRFVLLERGVNMSNLRDTHFHLPRRISSLDRDYRGHSRLNWPYLSIPDRYPRNWTHPTIALDLVQDIAMLRRSNRFPRPIDRRSTNRHQESVGSLHPSTHIWCFLDHLQQSISIGL